MILESFESSSTNTVSTVNNNDDLSSTSNNDFAHLIFADKNITVNTADGFSGVFTNADLTALSEDDSTGKACNDFPCFTSNSENISTVKHDNHLAHFTTQDDFAMFTSNSANISSVIPDAHSTNSCGNADTVSDISRKDGVLTSNINVAKPKFDFPNVVSKIESVSSAKGSDEFAKLFFRYSL